MKDEEVCYTSCINHIICQSFWIPPTPLLNEPHTSPPGPQDQRVAPV